MMSTVVAMGVGIFVILGMASSVSIMYSGSRSIQLSGEQLQILDDIRKTVETPVTCSALLTGKTLDLNQETDLNSITVRIGSQNRTLTVGQEIVPGLVLKSFGLVDNAVAQPQPIKLPVNGVLVDYMRRVASIVVETEKTGKVIGQSSPPISIPVNIITPVSGPLTIKECNGPAVFNASSCNDLGLVPIPDATLPTGFRCLPKDMCRKGGVYGTGPIGQGGFVNPMTGSQSCPTGYIAKRAGAITYTGDCGKTCLTRQTYPTFQCLACLDQDGQPLAMLPDPDLGVQDSTLDFSQEMEEADAAFDAQQAAINGITGTVTDPNAVYTCSQPGTVIVDQPCTQSAPQNVSPFAMCCSNSASICSVTLDVMDIGPVTVPERIVCN